MLSEQLKRMQSLGGRNVNQEKIDEMNLELKYITETYQQAIRDVAAGKQLNEGIFTSLKAAIGTGLKIGSAGAKKLASTAKVLSASVKNMYLDAKAQAELKVLITGVEKQISDFEKLASSVPTILERDPEIQKEIKLFSDLFYILVANLTERQEATAEK